MIDNIALLVPAYEPEEKMIPFLEELKDVFSTIVVVNDGSSSNEVFDKIPDGIKLLVHEVNKGKGRALKTGFEYIRGLEGIEGVVTADADGQHIVTDIVACCNKFLENPESAVFGCRDFGSESKIPPRSRFGNQLTSRLMKLFCSITLTDTQTGLRVLPIKYIDEFIATEGERYEYEMNCIMKIKELDLPLVEVPIEVIYIDNNKSSHFNPVVDSIKIYKVFIKFCLSSFGSFIVDILLFMLAKHFLKPVTPAYYIIVSTVLARICSGVFNYSINRMVFKSKAKASSSGPKYFILWLALMTASALIVNGLNYILPIGPTLIKIVVDTLLFICSYKVQQNWVYK